MALAIRFERQDFLLTEGAGYGTISIEMVQNGGSVLLSQKCQYALRATFELAKQYGKGPTKIADIAERQAIPTRFLERILNEMKKGGFFESRRGNEGGYLLVRDPRELAVGDIIEFVEGAFVPVSCMLTGGGNDDCQLKGNCVFLPMWRKIRNAVKEVYGATTMQELVEEEARTTGQYLSAYSI